MIEFHELTRKNFHQLIDLRVTPEQEAFVASNLYSVAESRVCPECVPLGVYDGETPVGFVMYGFDPREEAPYIYRVMVDRQHQSKGYGRQIMTALLERVRPLLRERRAVFLTCVPANRWGVALYTDLGFVPDGRMKAGEVVYRLDL